MKLSIKIFGISSLLFLLFAGCSHVNERPEAFLVEISNKGATEILDIELSMIGAKEVIKIGKLGTGQNSGSKTFILPIEPGEQSISWGDYAGTYSQGGTVKDISVLNFQHDFRPKIKFEIDNVSYITVFPWY